MAISSSISYTNSSTTSKPGIDTQGIVSDIWDHISGGGGGGGSGGVIPGVDWGVFEDLADSMGDMGHNFSSGFNKFGDDLKGGFSNFGDSMGDLANSIGGQTKELLKGFQEGASGIFDDIRGTGVFDAVGDIGDTFQDLTGGTLDLMQTMVTLGNDLVQILPKVLKTIAELLELTLDVTLQLLNYITDHPQQMKGLIIFFLVGWFLKNNSLLS